MLYLLRHVACSGFSLQSFCACIGNILIISGLVPTLLKLSFVSISIYFLSIITVFYRCGFSRFHTFSRSFENHEVSTFLILHLVRLPSSMPKASLTSFGIVILPFRLTYAVNSASSPCKADTKKCLFSILIVYDNNIRFFIYKIITKF